MNTDPRLLDGLVLFAIVVETGSFTAAAEQTGHSTSYISKQIHKLEDRLNVRLMNRTTRSLGLTPEGRLYYEKCQLIIEEAASATNIIHQQQGVPKGTLKISSPTSFGLIRLRPHLTEFMKCYPQIKVEIDLSDRHVDLISEGFDVVIRATGQLEDNSLIARKVLTARHLTLASPEYLERKGTPTQPAQLTEHDCICYSLVKNPEQWRYESESGDICYVDLEPHIISNSGQMNLNLAVAGQGICRSPDFNIDDELHRGRLIELFSDHKIAEVNLYLIYPSRQHLSPKVRSFVDFMAERLANTQK